MVTFVFAPSNLGLITSPFILYLPFLQRCFQSFSKDEMLYNCYASSLYNVFDVIYAICLLLLISFFKIRNKLGLPMQS